MVKVKPTLLTQTVGIVQAAWVVVLITTTLLCSNLSSLVQQFHSELVLNSSVIVKHVLKHLPQRAILFTLLLNQVHQLQQHQQHLLHQLYQQYNQMLQTRL